MLYARITAAMALLLQPADCLLLSAATVRAPVAHSASFALSPVAAPRSSIIEMGRVRARCHSHACAHGVSGGGGGDYGGGKGGGGEIRGGSGGGR